MMVPHGTSCCESGTTWVPRSQAGVVGRDALVEGINAAMATPTAFLAAEAEFFIALLAGDFAAGLATTEA